MPPKAAPLRERIEQNVVIDRDTGCWIWQLSVLKSGYGCIRVSGRTHTAHAVAYRVFCGQVPDGLELDHLCGVRECCNPQHLEPVTHRENVLRGRGRAAKAAITHCPHGHAYSEDNTYVNQGRRFCRACGNARARAYKARLRSKRSAA